jgi:hypothetical protein
MKEQYKHLSYTAVIAFGGLITALVLARLGLYSDLMIVIFFSGSIGSVVNNYYRLSKISRITQNLPEELSNPSVIIQMWISLFLGGILAFVIYGLFLSGLLQGTLFPRFNSIDLGYGGVGNMLMSVAPDTNMDAAKAIIWAFIAGFSEKYIPNIIDTIIATKEKAEEIQSILNSK